jgi:hypothetical protein
MDPPVAIASFVSFENGMYPDREILIGLVGPGLSRAIIETAFGQAKPVTKSRKTDMVILSSFSHLILNQVPWEDPRMMAAFFKT